MHHTQPQHTKPHQFQPATGRPGQGLSASRLLQLPPPESTLARTAACSGNRRELAHDARNLISALEVYCELLAAPGVLAPGFDCYAEDLRRLAGSGAGLIEALAAEGDGSHSRPSLGGPGEIDDYPPVRRPFPPIEDLGAELEALEAPLRALAGTGARLEVESRPCAGRLALNAEDLLRILFNLVANAAEALASLPIELRRRPFLRITAQRGGGASFLPGPPPFDGQTVLLSVRDNGPGIDARHLPHIFDAGFSTRQSDDADDRRGLGLAIVRRLVVAAGGAVRAVSASGLGARFDIELPILPPEAKEPRPKLAVAPLKRLIPDLKQISAQIEKEA